MAERHWTHRESDDDFDSPDEWNDESDVIACPECGAEVFDDSPLCPYCGRALSADTSPWTGRPLWWVLLGLLGVVATTLVLLGI